MHEFYITRNNWLTAGKKESMIRYTHLAYIKENTMNTEQYIKALNAHDWSFEWSDDDTVWKRGRQQRADLNAARQLLDADYAIWNAHCEHHYVVVAS